MSGKNLKLVQPQTLSAILSAGARDDGSNVYCVAGLMPKILERRTDVFMEAFTPEVAAQVNSVLASAGSNYQKDSRTVGADNGPSFNGMA